MRERAEMKLSQLRYFCEVYRLKNVSKAAETLYVSQPAVSTAIRGLESELQVILFLRVKGHLIPTEEGVRLFALASDVLDQIDQIPEQLRELSHRQSRITVGLPPVSTAFYIPALSEIKREYEASYPQMEVVLTEFPTFESARELLESGKTDLIFSTLDESSFRELERLTLFQTPIMLCVNVAHPLAREKTVDVRQLKDEPLVRTYHSVSAVYRTVQSYFARYGMTPDYKYSFTQNDAARLLLMNNEAVLLARPEMQTLDPSLVFVPFEEPLMIDVGVLWSGKKAVSSEIAAFIERLKQFYGGEKGKKRRCK